MIYKELEKRADEDISVHISYLEIYKEIGYDLLNPGARTQSVVTPFPKVGIGTFNPNTCYVPFEEGCILFWKFSLIIIWKTLCLD